jgi:hypothetical protein
MVVLHEAGDDPGEPVAGFRIGEIAVRSKQLRRSRYRELFAQHPRTGETE